MGFSKFSIPFCLLSFAALLLPQVVYGILNPIMHICSTPYHNPNDAFATNLKQLMTSLSQIVPGSGYGRVSLGQNSDKVYGIALCTGNIRNQQCKTCLDDAGSEIITRCPSNKKAIIWYDDCMLKYSDQEFYGRVDLGNELHQCNLRRITRSYRYKFAMARLSLFDILMTRIHENPNLYAAESVEMASSTTTNVKIYGFVQCSRDISTQRCRECLGRICERLRHTCYESLGGKYLTGSCSVRYELYPFAHA
ncbi:hypothetical protein K2173_009434 [Erythroxylum novogranatense]|uniref:Gnk2-homologous domain-containing protein n=1 Tax=Erythroxylum novogranatense TaxID=1862640 RepID=A0AAV8U834_9ROSI|nr:hypothetical protein K2173_009434 [Erythroxylum novogranatense]